MRAFRKSAQQEAEDPPPEVRPPASRHRRRQDENVNPPPNKPEDNLSAEERARRAMEANRAYFKASGMMDAFYLAYPLERPPGYVSTEERRERTAQRAALREQERASQRERGRGGRGER
jgi:hypothetical protein